MAEDAVARQMIRDHQNVSAERAATYTRTLLRMDQKFDMIWKEISRGRAMRARIMIAILGFMATLIVTLIAYIWSTSPAGAAYNCAPYKVAVAQLSAKHQERMVGLGDWRAGARVELWRTANGSTWTLLRVNAQGLACIGAAGENWRAAGRPDEEGHL